MCSKLICAIPFSRAVSLSLPPSVCLSIFVLSQIHFSISKKRKRNQNKISSQINNRLCVAMKCWLENWACNQIKFYFKHTHTHTHTRTHTENWRVNYVLSNEHYSFSRRFVLCGGEKCAWWRWHTLTLTQSHRVPVNQLKPAYTHTLFVIDLHTTRMLYIYHIVIMCSIICMKIWFS